MVKILRVIDFTSDQVGRITSWLSLALAALIAYEVIMRYIFDSPTIWTYETSLMLGATIYVAGWAYCHRHHAHIRIDILYERIAPRKKAVIDVLSFLFFSPVSIILTVTASSWAWRAWVIGEEMDEAFWYPPVAPLRTVVAIGFLLLTLQSVANFIRDLNLLIRNQSYD